MALTASGSAECIPARPWPAERVEFWSIERLIPYAANARRHSETDIEKIVASILKWGWTNPALVDEHGVLIAGHLRVAAAARMGVKSIPVLVAHGWGVLSNLSVAGGQPNETHSLAASVATGARG